MLPHNEEAEEYERLFRSIATWIRTKPDAETRFQLKRGYLSFVDMTSSPAGQFMYITTDQNIPIVELKGVVAYLRPGKTFSDGDAGGWFGYMRRCDVRGGGKHNWLVSDVMQFIRRLHEETVGPLPIVVHITVDETIKPPSCWIPMIDPIDMAVLGKLSEELAECSAIVARCMIQGIDETDPDDGTVNRQALENEMADVRAMIFLATERFIPKTGQIRMVERTIRKVSHKREWHRMLREKFGLKS